MNKIHQLMTAILLVFVSGCGGGGGGGDSGAGNNNAPAPVPVAAGTVSIAGSVVYSGPGDPQLITHTPGAQVWLGSASRAQLIFFRFRVQNTTPNNATVLVNYFTDMRCDGGVRQLYSLVSETVLIASGQAITFLSAIYCPGAELGQSKFQPTITVNGTVADSVDGYFDVNP